MTGYTKDATIRKLPAILLIALIMCTPCCSQIMTKEVCNRKIADQSLAKKLPKGICISEPYTVDQVISDLDFNHDGKKDVVVRYSEYPLKNGNARLYGIFQKTGDTTFILKKELKNISPPYLKNIYAATTTNDTLAARLASTYPYDLTIEFKQDTIKLSHLIPDYYGKTYAFVYDKGSENWYLRQTKYWIGGLDERDIDQMGLSPKLSRQNVIEVKKSKEQVPIQAFSLTESRP